MPPLAATSVQQLKSQSSLSDSFASEFLQSALASHIIIFLKVYNLKRTKYEYKEEKEHRKCSLNKKIKLVSDW